MLALSFFLLCSLASCLFFPPFFYAFFACSILLSLMLSCCFFACFHSFKNNKLLLFSLSLFHNCWFLVQRLWCNKMLDPKKFNDVLKDISGLISALVLHWWWGTKGLVAVKLYWFWEEGGSSFEPHWARTMSWMQTHDDSLPNCAWICSMCKSYYGMKKALIMFSLWYYLNRDRQKFQKWWKYIFHL